VILAQALERKDYEKQANDRLNRAVELYDHLGELKYGIAPSDSWFKDADSIGKAIDELSADDNQFQMAADKDTARVADHLSRVARR
jgi:hypothetical protein